MKALKIIGIVIGAIVVIAVAGIFILPSHSHVERSIVINATPDLVYQQVVSFKNFNNWSPWAKMDPDAKYEYSGPEAGVGAGMSWKSEKVGSGSQKIIEVKENERVKNELYFDGFDKPNYAEFVLTPEGNGTKVTWMYDGDMEGFYKYFGLMMDNMLGGQYETGLQSFKEVVESMPTTSPEPSDSTQVQQ